MLGLDENISTNTIEAIWSMSVWDDDRSKIIYTKNGIKHKFEEKSSHDDGTTISLPEGTNYIVTLKISKWTVKNCE